PGPHCLARIRDPLDPRRIGSTKVQPILGDIDPNNELVGHITAHLNKHLLLVSTPDCMRARAQSTVRVFDRDAGGSEMATVDKTYPRSECPPASPYRDPPSPGSGRGSANVGRKSGAHSATSISAARPSQVALGWRRSIRPDRAPWPRVHETTNAASLRDISQDHASPG